MTTANEHRDLDGFAATTGRAAEAAGRAHSALTFGGEGAEKHYPPDLALEPLHLDISVVLDLELQTAALKVATTVVGNHSGADSITLDGIGFRALTVVDKDSGKLSFSYDGKKIAIRWDTPFALGERRTVVTSYLVEQPVSGLFFMKPTAAAPRKDLYAATDHETERARYWLSCVDLPNVRTTLDIRLTAAANLTLLANGTLQTESTTAGKKTAHWRLEQRCPSYLICFAVGDFVRFDDGDVDGIPLAYFTGKDFAAADLAQTFGRTRPMLQWMQKRLGVKFPFPKYYQFALPAFSGAMENISLVSWDDKFVNDARRAPEQTWLTDQINVHEMAHSYFGDLVVCRDYAHAWLKESWATYIEACWLEDSKGKDEQHYDLYCNAHAYFDEADNAYARPLVTRKFTSSWQMYDRHLYPGGACRLHTLRCELGDDVFWGAVTDYLKVYSEQVVETDDFRRILEKHSGRSLQQFFDQWVHTPSYPEMKVKFVYDSDKKLGTFTVEQKQVNSKKEVPPFLMTVDLGWTGDGETHLRSVRLTEARHSFQFAMPKDPEQVRFDPEWKALHKLSFDPGETRLKHQLTGAKDVVGRILAAKTLCESGSRASVEAVGEAYKKESFWGVRREMAKALAASHSEAAILCLVDLIATEKDPMVMEALFASAGKLRDGRIAAALTKRSQLGELPPGAQAAVYQALGNQREAAPLGLLQAGATREEPRYGLEQAAAFTALGKTRRAEMGPLLLAASQYGKTTWRARYGAVVGLGSLAPYVDKGLRTQIEERLIDLLRDPEPPLRMVAARSLKVMRARGAGAALEALRAQLPLQEQVAIDSVLLELRRDEDSRVKGLEKDLDDMQARMRKLGDRLQDLEDKLKLAKA